MTQQIISRPHFICIGAQKGGTSWLFDNLLFHPDTAMPPLKEINYFLEGVAVDHTRQRVFSRLKECMSRPNKYIFWYLTFLRMGHTTENYCKLFSRKKISGDMSPSYAPLPREKVAQIAQAAPNAKILYLLRNPVDRTWSALRMTHGTAIKHMSVEEIKPLLDVAHSMYSQYIRTWQEFYGPDQFRLFFYDDLQTDPENFFYSVCRYLGIREIADFPGTKIDKVIHKSESAPMPPAIRQHLLERFADELHTLNETVNNKHTNKWLEEAVAGTAPHAVQA